MSIAEIADEVSFHFNIPTQRLRAPGRAQSVARARQVAMYISRQLTSSSFPEIGAWFGGRHHTTVIHACRNVERLWRRDGRLAGMVDGICEVLMRGRAA
jgi:chromosomal replication initiator protein